MDENIDASYIWIFSCSMLENNISVYGHENLAIIANSLNMPCNKIRPGNLFMTCNCAANIARKVVSRASPAVTSTYLWIDPSSANIIEFYCLT